MKDSWKGLPTGLMICALIMWQNSSSAQPILLNPCGVACDAPMTAGVDEFFFTGGVDMAGMVPEQWPLENIQFMYMTRWGDGESEELCKVDFQHCGPFISETCHCMKHIGTTYEFYLRFPSLVYLSEATFVASWRSLGNSILTSNTVRLPIVKDMGLFLIDPCGSETKTDKCRNVLVQDSDAFKFRGIVNHTSMDRERWPLSKIVISKWAGSDLDFKIYCRLDFSKCGNDIFVYGCQCSKKLVSNSYEFNVGIPALASDTGGQVRAEWTATDGKTAISNVLVIPLTIWSEPIETSIVAHSPYGRGGWADMYPFVVILATMIVISPVVVYFFVKSAKDSEEISVKIIPEDYDDSLQEQKIVWLADTSNRSSHFV